MPPARAPRLLLLFGMGLLGIPPASAPTCPAALPDPIEPDARGTLAFDAARPVRPIRVLLGVRELWEVRVEGPYRVVQDTETATVLASGESLPTTPISVQRGKWFQFAPVTSRHTSLILETEGDGTVWVGDRRYRGRVRFSRLQGKYIEAVNEVELDDYLASVISCEMPATFPAAAQESQVIAARTYALYHVLTRGNSKSFDVHDTSRSQNYRGVEYLDRNGRRLAAETVASRKIVAATRQQVLTYEGRLFCSYYSATCGGHTTDARSIFGPAQPPTLSGTPSDFCQGAPNYRWTRRARKELVLAWLNVDLTPEGKALKDITTISKSETAPGQVASLRFSDGERRRTVSAWHLRNGLNGAQLPSPFFTATIDGDAIVFAGRGWGHGVGFCQWGSKTLGEQGKSTAEILAHFYPGSTLVRLSSP